MISEWRLGVNPYFVYEFETSILVLNEIQYYPGHSILLLKDHAREVYDLSLLAYQKLSQELYVAAKAVAGHSKPLKMNIQALGNQEPHVHWHIIPRYESDPNARQQPFSESIRNEISLEAFKIKPGEQMNVTEALRTAVKLTDAASREKNI
jgi:diadenosine tetraphosphate (Ap4A) HIT family hydrolase